MDDSLMNIKIDYLFVQGENGEIVLLEPEELQEIYREDYSSMDYKQFIYKALNQELIINTKDKGETFSLDKDVTDNYMHNNFPDFLKLYCEESQRNNKLWLKTNLEEHQLFSIFYYFFINNHLTAFDDYFGNYYLSKASELT